jgi:hypothetical protein
MIGGFRLLAASYLTMRGQRWMIGQHDDRFYHRRRWERSERSETTSASRIEYPNRCDWRCSHDRERGIRRVRNNSVGRCHVEIFVRPMRYKGCQQAHNAQVVICALFTTRDSLKLQGRRRNYRGGERRFHRSQSSCHIAKVVLTIRHDSRQIPIASDARPFHTSRGGLRTPAPPCAPHHLHGAGIRNPSQRRK